MQIYYSHVILYSRTNMRNCVDWITLPMQIRSIFVKLMSISPSDARY